MAHLTGIFRLGRDAVVRRTQSGDSVASLALAFNYGQKGQDGNRPSQWVNASMWGARAEKMAPHLTKGTLVYAVLGEPHLEEYQGRNGPGVSLVARVLDIEFAGGRREEGSGGGERPAQQQPRQQPPQQADLSDFDDDIPF